MSQKTALIAELKMEAGNTRKILERVPMDKADWKPHAKSMALGRLAIHVADTPQWVTRILETSELDLMNSGFRSHTAAGSQDLVGILEEVVNAAVASLENATDEDFDKPWTLRRGDQVFFTLPKKVVLRTFAYSHAIHHRGQLSVYLRLLDVPVPGMYGPTADEI